MAENMSTTERYVQEIHTELHTWATWPPNAPMNIGDVGIFRSSVFHKLTSLAELGVNYYLNDGTPGEVTYGTRGGYQLSVKLAGQVNPLLPDVAKGSAGIGVRFTADWAVVVSLAQVTPTYINNLESVAEQLRSRNWDRRWVLINTVSRAKAGTILISNTEGASIQLAAAARVASNEASLAGEIKLEIAKKDQVSYHLIAGRDLVPLYGALGRKDIWYNWMTRRVGPSRIDSSWWEISPAQALALELNPE